MEFVHKHLDDLLRAYAASILEIDGETCCLVASEEKGYPCYMYSGQNFENREVVWEDGGGCMSIIQIPNKINEFVAVREFYLKESPSRSKLVWGKYSKETGWVIKDLYDLAYVHRFDIYRKGDKNFLVAATIADDKDFKDDWTRPGSIYLGQLPDDLDNEKLVLNKIGGGYFRNHGYYQFEGAGYFTSDQGIERLIVNEDGSYQFEHILDGMIGEVALMDIKNSGSAQLMTIEPFHGNKMYIYELNNETDKYERVWEYPFEVDFAHTLVGNTLNGVPCFVGGVRRVNCELFVITYENGDYKLTLVDEGAGPSNLMIGHLNNGQDFIISANHTRNESAVYFVK